jgi:hypothetical protein
MFIVIPFWIDIMKYLQPVQKSFIIPKTLEKKIFCENTGCNPSNNCTTMNGLFPKNTELNNCQ